VSVSGTVINLNAFGATVRLESGEIAHAAAEDVEAHRRQYERSFSTRSCVAFVRHGESRRATVALVPQISDERLEEQITSYLKSTEEWEGERPAHERHFLRKKRRAAHWEPK
jgi:hypothetical protein